MSPLRKGVAIAQVPSPGSIIKNQATGSFVNQRDRSIQQIESRRVQTTVAATTDCALGGGTSDANITPYISAEVYRNNIAKRAVVDTLDDDWLTALGQATDPTLESWFGTTAQADVAVANFSYLDPAQGSNTPVAVELVQVPVTGFSACNGAATTGGGLPDLAVSPTLQSSSPRPASLYDSSRQPAFWNESNGGNSNDNQRNAIRFTFEQPVKSFGAWFGDLETRADGDGTLPPAVNDGSVAILRLLDSAGQKIGEDIAIVPNTVYNGNPPTPSVPDQENCGVSNSTVGCGNQSTRWVGFIDRSSIARVSQVLVIVGDDDGTLNENSGDSEHISFIGGNLPLTIPNNPNLLLVKRITAINRGLANEQLFDNSYVDVGTSDDDDNAVNWPGEAIPATLGSGTVERYLAGITGINEGAAVVNTIVRPGDEIEYTISFLSAGDAAAKGVLICDRVPANTTFVTHAFNDLTSAWMGGGDRGIFLDFNNTEIALTNTNDGTELLGAGASGDIGGYYFPSGIDPGLTFPRINCNGENTHGVVVVEFSDIPYATGEGIPSESHGFIRFKVVVN